MDEVYNAEGSVYIVIGRGNCEKSIMVIYGAISVSFVCECRLFILV